MKLQKVLLMRGFYITVFKAHLMNHIRINRSLYSRNFIAAIKWSV